MSASETFAYASTQAEIDAAAAESTDVIILGRLEGPYQNEDAREWERSVGYHLFSPTQISTFLECPRKWAWRRIAHVVTPQNASAFLGSRVHEVLEDYLREGKRPDFVKDRVVADIATSGLHFLPEPKTPGMVLEEEFRFQSPRTSFVYHGYKDVSLPPGVPVPALGFDGQAPIVIDHKSTKSIGKWAKSTDDLRIDAQSCLYGYDAMFRFGVPLVDLGWLYYQTEGPRRATPTTIRLTSRELAPVFDAVERVAEEAATALDKKLQPLDLPPNVSACGAYGGCPYKHLCTDLNKSSQILRRNLVSNTIADLRARVQGLAPAPTIITEKAPEAKTYLIERGEQKFVGKGSTLEEAKADAQKQADAASTPAPATPPADAPANVNPPESTIPPANVEAKTEEPKTKKPRASKKDKTTPAETKDPIGADAAMHTGIDEKKKNESVTGRMFPPGTEGVPPERVLSEADAGALLDTIERAAEEAAREGFTLYVDCLPIGRPAKCASRLIAKAQERMLVDGPRDVAGQPVPDYRLVDYGKGAPAFVSFVLDQIDGSFDLTLDTRSPEGAVLLEPLMAKAAFVVRGLR